MKNKTSIGSSDSSEYEDADREYYGLKKFVMLSTQISQYL